MYYYIWYAIVLLAISCAAAFGLPRILIRFFPSAQTQKSYGNLAIESILKVDATNKTKIAIVRAENDKFLLVISENYTNAFHLSNKSQNIDTQTTQETKSTLLNI